MRKLTLSAPRPHLRSAAIVVTVMALFVGTFTISTAPPASADTDCSRGTNFIPLDYYATLYGIHVAELNVKGIRKVAALKNGKAFDFTSAQYLSGYDYRTDRIWMDWSPDPRNGRYRCGPTRSYGTKRVRLLPQWFRVCIDTLSEGRRIQDCGEWYHETG